MGESVIEEFLVREINRRQGLALKLLSPNMAGLPDRLVLLPEGILFFAELKAKGKKPRPLQRAVHRKLQALGFPVYTLDSKEGVQEVLKQYGVCTPSISKDCY